VADPKAVYNFKKLCYKNPAASVTGA
jgi:hypothetical protein